MQTVYEQAYYYAMPESGIDPRFAGDRFSLLATSRMREEHDWRVRDHHKFY